MVLTYGSNNSWENNGVNMYGVDISLTNHSDQALSSWTLVAKIPGLASVEGWNGTWTVNGDTLTVTNAEYNGNISVNNMVFIGCNMGVKGGLNIESATINGTPCTIVKGSVDQNAQNMFLTLFLGVLDCETGELGYCNAGHNAPAIMVNGEWTQLDVVPNLPLGIEPEFTFQAQQTHLQHGDILFLYTDGLTEAENKRHELYGEERMLNELKSERMKGLSPRHMINAMQASVEAYREGAEQSDDLTMLVVRYQTPALMMRNDIEQIPTLAE
jgi:hypothetical protein